jgi:Mg-chelatase subunit ChlD
MQNKITRGKRSTGIAIVLTTLSMSLILPLVGLGFDVSTLYLIRSKLSAAADSAALAGARALSQGANSAAQKANAVNTAQSFFSANFPAGYWRTTGGNATVSVDDTSYANYRVVSVTATVQAPLYFLRVLNQQASTINVASKAGRRDVMLMMVLDRSSSMTGVVAGTGQTACDLMKTDAATFVNYFAPGRDQLGLVVFGSTVYFYQSTTSFTTPDGNGNTIQSLIAQISCGGNTSSAEAIATAYAELVRVNDNKRMNVIMFMTDGRPNGITANYYNLVTDGCVPASKQSQFVGVLSQWAGGAVTTGTTAGLMNYTTTSITDANEGPISAGSGCKFYSPNNSTANLPNVRQDISNLPTQDLYGNSTSGPYSNQNSAAWPFTTAFNRIGGASSPLQIVIASENILDNEATQVRTDANLHPYIYDIALEGDGATTDQPDTLLLRKIANDPSLASDTGIGSTFYRQQIGQPHGYFAEAPDASQLAVAFDTIATQITIRLAQ